jgi:hypothetical protein
VGNQRSRGTMNFPCARGIRSPAMNTLPLVSLSAPADTRWSLSSPELTTPPFVFSIGQDVESFEPPATKMLPAERCVAVWLLRGMLRFPVRVRPPESLYFSNVAFAGSSLLLPMMRLSAIVYSGRRRSGHKQHQPLVSHLNRPPGELGSEIVSRALV